MRTWFTCSWRWLGADRAIAAVSLVYKHERCKPTPTLPWPTRAEDLRAADTAPYRLLGVESAASLIPSVPFGWE